ncbi:MAG: PA0069 family radical SAM protein [bacterium]
MSDNKVDGRGANFDPSNRFQELNYSPDDSEHVHRDYETTFYRDSSQTVLAENNSPDVPFTYSVNPYRGCEHGCIYCYARPSHEYLGFSAGLDFESKIIVKEDAPELLAEEFEDSSWKPQTICISGNTDPYQPAESHFEITRALLNVCRDYRNPVSMITKNHLITRDLDVLTELAELDLVHVQVSVTTLKREIARVMEPRTSRPGKRLDAIEALAERDVSVGVNAAPIVPGLTDEELPAILEEASDRGATQGSYIVMRLPGPVKKLFVDWVREEFPDRADKILSQIRSVREGQLNESEFGDRMTGKGELGNIIDQMHRNTCNRLGLNETSVNLSTEHFRRSGNRQKDLFINEEQ